MDPLDVTSVYFLFIFNTILKFNYSVGSYFLVRKCDPTIQKEINNFVGTSALSIIGEIILVCGNQMRFFSNSESKKILLA